MEPGIVKKVGIGEDIENLENSNRKDFTAQSQRGKAAWAEKKAII